MIQSKAGLSRSFKARETAVGRVQAVEENLDGISAEPESMHSQEPYAVRTHK